MGKLCIRPISFRKAAEYVGKYHRHNKPPVGCKFCISVVDTEEEKIVGVAMVGRPIARHFDDGLTLEINRTCTDGTKNANSMLYGASRVVGFGMGYNRIITYTQLEETGASLRGAGFVRVKELPARKSWAESSVKLRKIRDEVGNGGVDRVLWEVKRK